MIYDSLQQLLGKTITNVIRDKHDAAVIVGFSDGTFWVVRSQIQNCHGTSLSHLVMKTSDLSEETKQ